MTKQDKFDAFVEQFEQLLSQENITEKEFLDVAKQAIAAYREDPENREEIAYDMTGLWIVTEEKMGEQYTEETAIADIGSDFAGLELPDRVADIGDYDSVDDKWKGLDQKINNTIK